MLKRVRKPQLKAPFADLRYRSLQVHIKWASKRDAFLRGTQSIGFPLGATLRAGGLAGGFRRAACLPRRIGTSMLLLLDSQR